MDGRSELVERGIPDLMQSDGLPVAIGAEVDFLAGRPTRLSLTPDALSARTFAMAGARAQARRILARLDVDALSMHEVVAATWAVSRVGSDHHLALDLRRRLDVDTEFLVDDVPLGPRTLFTGLLAATEGDLPSAADALRAAVTIGDRRAPLWGALARSELARVLRSAETVDVTARGIVGDGELDRIEAAARTFFVAGGYRSLAARLDDGRAVVGVLTPGPTWVVGFGVQPVVEVSPGKGLVALRHLIEHRDRVVSAAELVRLLDGEDHAGLAEHGRRLVMDGRSTEFEGNDDLRAELFSETTRSRVGKLLRRTIARVAGRHGLLGAHLTAAVHTGYGCGYATSSVTAIRWEL